MYNVPLEMKPIKKLFTFATTTSTSFDKTDRQKSDNIIISIRYNAILAVKARAQ